MNLWGKGEQKENNFGGIVGLCSFILVKMVEYPHFSMVQASSFLFLFFEWSERMLKYVLSV